MGMLTNGLILWGLIGVGADDRPGRRAAAAISLTLREPRGERMTATPLVRLERLRKEFGAVVARRGADARRRRGRDRRARRRQRRRQVDGREVPRRRLSRRPGADPARRASRVDFSSPLDARGHGIEVVFQDLALANAQPVYMNMFLGRELVKGPLRRLDRAAMAAADAGAARRARRAHRQPAGDDPRPVRRPAPGRGDRARRCTGRSGSC